MNGVLALIAPAPLIAGCAVLGLLFGSFFTVLVHRLPRRLLGDSADTLWAPRSHCPHCRHVLSAWENLPLLSWLGLRGRCRACHTPVGWHYPLLEAGSMLLAAALAWHFGAGWSLAGALLLCGFLLPLAVIDARTGLLPDSLTRPLLWLGLLFNLSADGFAPLPSAVIGAAGGYAVLWLTCRACTLLTGRDGMGHGDFKLLAAIGAWLGWPQLGPVLLLAAGSAALVGVLLIASGRRHRHDAIPFGPYLAAAAVVVLWRAPF